MSIKQKRTMKHKRPPIAIEHTAFYPYFQRHNETMQVRNYSASILQRRESNLRRFIAWCDERSIATPQDVTKPILESYQRHLFYYRQDNGECLSAGTGAGAALANRTAASLEKLAQSSNLRQGIASATRQSYGGGAEASTSFGEAAGGTAADAASNAAQNKSMTF